MAINLADLLSLRTAAQLYNEALALISAAALPVANWRTGGPYKTLVSIHSTLIEKLHQVQVAFVQSGFLASASGAWLTLLSESLFGEARQASTSTEGTVTLTAAVGAGPYTLNPGAVIVSTAGGLKYRATNAAALTLPAGGSVSVPIKAESPGAKYNVGGGAITILSAPTLLGVTVSNAASWQTAAGADEETDDKLRTRCLAKWGTLSTGSPESAYRNWALTASAEIAKVGVHSALKDGAFANGYVTLVLAGAAGAVSDAAVKEAQNLINPKVPVGTKVSYKKATAKSVSITGTVYCSALHLAAVQAGVQAALDALAAATPLGGTVYPDQISDAIHYDGLPWPTSKVRNVELTAPLTPQVLTYLEFVAFTNGLTFVGV